jgi:hypothetical protein
VTTAPLELADRFERLELDPGSFRHRDHVAAAYAMLRKYPFLEALSRYASTIRTMATNAGAATKFHVTITVAFMALIAERMESSPHRDFDDFSREHPDLFASDILERFYPPDQLQSQLARKIFVMPDMESSYAGELPRAKPSR